jgi:excisionase family DNA binding protein
VPADALAALDAIELGAVPAAILRLTARLVPAPPSPAAPTPSADDLLTPDEAAALLKCDRRFVYRHARELGAIRLSRRTLRLSRKRILRWLEGRR